MQVKFSRLKSIFSPILKIPSKNAHFSQYAAHMWDDQYPWTKVDPSEGFAENLSSGINFIEYAE